jgi:type II secretory pathway pseudopilin PulG
MLIVVAIIGILVAIAVPALSTAKSDAQAAKLKAAQSSVALAKNRVVLADPSAITSTAEAAVFADLAPYLIINGSTPANWAAVFAGTGKVASEYADDESAMTALGLETDYSGL